MKKGQAEMLGLVIIIILLIISLLFYVSLKSNEQKETELIRSSIRANNILNAILLVNIDDKQVKDLLKECIDEMSVEPTSCDDIKNKLKGIFDMILLEKQKYRFGAFLGDYEIFNIGEISCEDFITANPARFPGDYRYEFQLCYS